MLTAKMSSARASPRSSFVGAIEKEKRKRRNSRQPAWMVDMPQLEFEIGAGQIVGPQKLGESPGALTVSAKVPFEERVDPLIEPADERFRKTEQYFATLLKTDASLDQILEANFDSHEIELIRPAAGPPDLLRWHKENSIRYQRHLNTVFKGCAPTMALKMAMLYFGLPVAPIKVGTDQSVQIDDLDLLEDDVEVQPDPMNFLGMYTERCYGDPEKRGKWWWR